MGNPRGSSPILGLKEATLELGEARHKQLHTTHSHNMHDHNNITRILHHTLQDNPTQGLHKDSTIESSYRVKVGSLHEEDFQTLIHKYAPILIINMPF